MIPYQPVRVGTLYDMRNVVCYGFAYDPNRALIALSVQGSSIQIEQLHYKIQGQDYQVGLNVDYEHRSSNRFAYANKARFRVFKTPVPDTTEVSLILLNESLFKPVRDTRFTYVWNFGSEAIKNEIYQRVKQVVYVAVKPEWASYLMTEGMIAQSDPYDKYRLCGVLPNLKDTANFMCAGFDIAYILNERVPWEKVITNGLKKKAIKL